MSNARYELRRMPLARGVLGEVWQGRDRCTGRDVAVKFPRTPAGAERDEIVRWFHHETAILASLRHPGVPEMLGAGVNRGRPYLVMELVPGCTASDLVARHGAVSACTAAAIAVQVCEVLAAVHERSLVHRDIELANLMVRPDGAVRLLDFGLASALGSDSWPWGVPGTPVHRAPEQPFSSPRGDLYALGCTLHEMLTGSRAGREFEEFAAFPRVPAGLAEVLRALLAPDPRDRPASAFETRHALLPYAASHALPTAVRSAAA